MSNTSYYIVEPDLNVDGAVVSAISAMLEEATVQALSNPTKTITKTIKLLGTANVGSQLVVETYNIVVNGETSQAEIAGALYDMQIGILSTAAAGAILGMFTGGILLAGGTILTAGALAGFYSAFLEDDVNDAIETLIGKDMVQFFDAQGEHTAGIVFGDGIPAGSSSVAELDAVWAFITNENSTGLDLTGGHIQVDTGLGIDNNYYVYDGNIYSQVANTLGVSLLEFRTTDNGSLTNDAYYAEAGHGNYIFFEEDNIQIGIPVNIGGQDSVVIVQNIYGSAVHDNNRLIGDDEFFEENLVIGNGSGTGGDGRDLVIGGAGGDVITGGDDDDILIGGDGNDTIKASEDNDTIDGGDGEDWMDYTVLDSLLDNDVTVNLNLNNSTINYLLDDDHQEIYNVEHIKTGDGHDEIHGNELSNEIITNSGSDVIIAGAGDDTIDAGDDNYADNVRGGEGADHIETGGGNDWVHTNGILGQLDVEADYVDAGAGDDSIYGTFGGDTLIGGMGDDYIESKGDATLMGGAGLDIYEAKAGDVIIDADGGRFNGASFIQGGEHIWHDGTTIHPFKVHGNNLYVYNGGLDYAPSDTYFVIQGFVNDGRWGFTIPQEYYDAKNEHVIDVAGSESPDENIHPEGSSTILDNPTSGHPNENPSAANPTIIADSTNQHEHGYTNHDNFLMASEGFDTQEGGTANDTFGWGSGFHDDLIIDAGGTNDRIVMANLNESDVHVEQVGDDIVIRAATSANLEELTIQGHYLATGAVESIVFADGSILSLGLSSTGHSNAIEYIEITGASDDTIVAMGGADTIRSWQGNDSIDAGAGADSVYADDGNDTVLGGSDDDYIHAGLGNDSLEGGTGADFIYGDDGADTITGGGGNDTLKGYLGSDTYIWGVGDGDDTIEESAFSGGGNDTLKLIGGITLADLDIYGTAGYNINIVYIPTGEHITLSKMFEDTDRMIETIVFDDGSTYNLDQGVEWRGGNGDDYINASAHDDTLSGNELNDTLDSGHGNDTLIGGLGQDLLLGDAGDDTYIWSAGDGNDIIQEDRFEANSGNDKIQMTGGITLSDIEVYGVVGGSVMITYVPTSETITVNYQFVDTDYRVETIEFDDGTIFNLTSGINNWYGTSGNDNLIGTSNHETYLAEAGNDSVRGGGGNDTIEGADGSDTLKGESGDDWLTGGLDVDTLQGGSGGDTYFWTSGDGNDIITESSGSDVLKMTGGITASDLTFVGGASQDLLITYTPTGEVLTIKDHHYHSYQDYRIETIEFDDGSTYSLLEGVEWFGTTGNDVLKAGKYDDTISGDSGNDKLYGYAGNDSITGGSGSDTLYGYDGDDTYVWAAGDGNDTIQEWNKYGGDETLLMTGGITSSDVTFADSGNHLIITYTPTGETIKINYQNYYDSDYHVETLAFDDGSTIDLLGV